MEKAELTGDKFNPEILEKIINDVVEPLASQIDETGAYPREALDALGQAGLLGLISSRDVGGLGESHRAAALVISRLAEACASTAMVVCMHYSAAAVVEAYGPKEIRENIAQGKHITTLAFSEAGSRSHFWAPLSTAEKNGEGFYLNAQKSWATSAGQADSYVWSSRALNSDGGSTIWLVKADSEGLKIPTPFDGLGLRGNYSSPITADNVFVTAGSMLGNDGDGFNIMMGVVLPYFSIMSAAFSVGTMEAATGKSIKHLTNTKFQHLGQSLADLPTIRAYISRMRIKTDMSRALLFDTITSVEQGLENSMLRILEVKAATGEAATEVTDLAMRICGGAAFRKENGIERHFRDARASTVMAPTTDVLYDFIGKAICGISLFE